MVKIDNTKVWHTPIKAFSDFMGEAEKHGIDNVMQQGRFQKVRETRTLAVLCFAMYKMTGTPWYLRLDKTEATDGRIMRESPHEHGTNELANVEITSYVRRGDGKKPTNSLLEQLKKTKTFSTHHKYGAHDLVLVDLGNSYSEEPEVDFENIATYLRSIKAPYQLWTIEQVEHDNPNTIIRITSCTPEVEKYRLDVGEAWDEQKKKGIRGAVVKERTADPSKVGVHPGGPDITWAPWEFQDD